MKNDFNFIMINNSTRVTVFNGTKIATNFSLMPKKFIQIIADRLKLSLYGEMSMYSGKQIFKVGKIVNENGGVVNLFTTESKAKFNRFVCEYVNQS